MHRLYFKHKGSTKNLQMTTNIITVTLVVKDLFKSFQKYRKIVNNFKELFENSFNGSRVF